MLLMNACRGAQSQHGDVVGDQPLDLLPGERDGGDPVTVAAS
jgi:hypothetical protein